MHHNEDALQCCGSKLLHAVDAQHNTSNWCGKHCMRRSWLVIQPASHTTPASQNETMNNQRTRKFKGGLQPGSAQKPISWEKPNHTKYMPEVTREATAGRHTLGVLLLGAVASLRPTRSAAQRSTAQHRPGCRHSVANYSTVCLYLCQHADQTPTTPNCNVPRTQVHQPPAMTPLFINALQKPTFRERGSRISRDQPDYLVHQSIHSSTRMKLLHSAG